MRLVGPQSNKALLGFGWAAAELKQPKEALVPWAELSGREDAIGAVAAAEVEHALAGLQLQRLDESAGPFVVEAVAGIDVLPRGLDFAGSTSPDFFLFEDVAVDVARKVLVEGFDLALEDAYAIHGIDGATAARMRRAGSHRPQHVETPRQSRTCSKVCAPSATHWRISRSVTALQMHTYMFGAKRYPEWD